MKVLRIVIADDDPLVALGLEVQLGRLGHRVVGVAGNGLEAVAFIQKYRPDLAILDIKLPEMSGLEASQLVMAQTPLPIILLTGYPIEGLSREINLAGAIMCLVKPVDEQDLEPAITLALDNFLGLSDRS